MVEYIEKQAARPDEFCVGVSCQECPFLKDHLYWGCRVDDFIMALPPADVRPVRRGRWEMDSDNVPHCTECGCVAPQRLFLHIQSLACTSKFIMSNYCPDCGSYNGTDMRGGDADG